MQIIIDGYNLIYAIDETRPYGSPRSSGAERRKLLELLGKYARLSGSSLTIVFDGPPGKHGPGDAENVNIIFSHEKSADRVIKGMVESSSHARDLAVVSSDREIRTFVKRCGANSVSTKAFVKEIREIFREKSKEKRRREPRDKILQEGEVDAEYWLDYFGLDKEEIKRQNKKLKDTL